MNNKSFKLILLSSILLLISACGGGSSSQSNDTATGQEETANPIVTPVTRPQPRALDTTNWINARLIQTANPTQSNVEVVGTELIIDIESADISQGAHLQIYLNTDNKPETGFQFINEAWEESGVDYLIEDGDLFKSTANNTGWNWNVNAGAIDYNIDTDTATAKIDLSLLGDICNNLKIGVMTRDEFWDISTFSPASSQMQTVSVSYCNTDVVDTVKPAITLLGANPLNLNINDTYVDPGATAIDNIDGDISNQIIPYSIVNTALAGTYEVSYLVTDLAGNSATISRVVIVNDVALPEGIVIDGNSEDWNDIPTFSSSADAIMKVSDDEEKLYILVTSNNLGENIQVLMDTDNNTLTGLDLSAQIYTWVGGADYMIENNSLDKSKSNTLWSWDYGIAAIEYIQTSDTLEIAIRKSDFNFLANKVSMGFVSRTENWNVNYILPLQSLPVYTMQFANEVNPVSANNDSITTPNNEALEIDVLANDISLSNSALTVSLTTEPEFGTATVIQSIVNYTPDPSFTGTLTFTYQISDNSGNVDTATIKVIVTAPTNNPPVANDDSATTTFNQAVDISVLTNDSDADGDTFIITNVSSISNGTGEINGNKLRYTPATGFSGTDTFTYIISDGNGGSATATVTVVTSANMPPMARDDSYTIDVATQTSVLLDVLDNDSDPDGDSLLITNVPNAPRGNYSISNNKILFEPSGRPIGNLPVPYTISDGNGGTATAIFNLEIINSTNINPIAANDTVTTTQGQAVSFNVLLNDSDADQDLISIQSYSNDITNGTLTSNGQGNFTYTPNPNFTGVDSFNYDIEDENYGPANASVTITVNDPTQNNTPDAVEDSSDVLFDQTITIDVLSNDTDPDNDVLSVLSIVQPPVGIASLNANGTIFFDPQNNIGSISIGYTLSDSRGGTDFAVLTVSSTDPNNGNFGWPVIVDEKVTTTMTTPIFIDVLANDSDPDRDILILDQLSGFDNGTAIKINGGIRYTPDPGFIGTDYIYYGVHDGFGHNGFGTVTVTVTQ